MYIMSAIAPESAFGTRWAIFMRLPYFAMIAS